MVIKHKVKHHLKHETKHYSRYHATDYIGGAKYVCRIKKTKFSAHFHTI